MNRTIFIILEVAAFLLLIFYLACTKKLKTKVLYALLMFLFSFMLCIFYFYTFLSIPFDKNRLFLLSPICNVIYTVVPLEYLHYIFNIVINYFNPQISID